MKQENFRKIEQALAGHPSPQAVRVLVHGIIENELSACPEIQDEDRQELSALLCLVHFPLKVEQVCIRTETSDVSYEPSRLVGVAMGIITCAALNKMPLLHRVLLSVIGGVGVDYAAQYYSQKRKKTNHRNVMNIQEKLLSSVEDIQEQVDKIVRLLVLMTVKPKATLSSDFPNILKWYQAAYADCGDFGSECATHFRRRIESVLRQCYCELVNYDGTNEHLFETELTSRITEPAQELPAITAQDGYLLPGKLFFPYNEKDNHSN